jgi:hypothetical protein
MRKIRYEMDKNEAKNLSVRFNSKVDQNSIQIHAQHLNRGNSQEIR